MPRRIYEQVTGEDETQTHGGHEMNRPASFAFVTGDKMCTEVEVSCCCSPEKKEIRTGISASLSLSFMIAYIPRGADLLRTKMGYQKGGKICMKQESFQIICSSSREII